jgi:hypothetical protein
MLDVRHYLVRRDAVRSEFRVLPVVAVGPVREPEELRVVGQRMRRADDLAAEADRDIQVSIRLLRTAITGANSAGGRTPGSSQDAGHNLPPARLSVVRRCSPRRPHQAMRLALFHLSRRAWNKAGLRPRTPSRNVNKTSADQMVLTRHYPAGSGGNCRPLSCRSHFDNAAGPSTLFRGGYFFRGAEGGVDGAAVGDLTGCALRWAAAPAAAASARAACAASCGVIQASIGPRAARHTLPW